MFTNIFCWFPDDDDKDVRGRKKNQRGLGKNWVVLYYDEDDYFCVCVRNKDQRGRNNQAVGADSFHHQSVETQTQTSITKHKIQIKIKHKSIFADFKKIPKLADSMLGMDILTITMVKHDS